MSASMPARDKQDLDKFIKFLCIKSTQIIVQGRTGLLISTPYQPSIHGSEWFNLGIKDYPDIDREAKSAISVGNPNKNQSFVVEISLKTSDADDLVLEVWSIGFINKYKQIHIRQEVYNHVALLLKSLLCVSRLTPAYKLSRRQGNEFVMCYKVYNGHVGLSGLGEGFKTLSVGNIGTPVGTYTMQVAYRTIEKLHVSQQQISPEAIMPFELHDDHFSVARSNNTAKPCYALQSRLRTLSETSDGPPALPSGSSRNSPSYNLFNTSLSQSPLKRNTPRDDDRPTFTVGTPPGVYLSAHKSISSPILAKENRRLSFPTSPTECNPSCKYGKHSPNCYKRSHMSHRSKRSSLPHASGSSAPVLPIRFSSVGTSPESVLNRLVGGSPSDGVQRRTPPVASRTTYRHWSNSNVTKVTAGQNVVQAGVQDSSGEIEAEWVSSLDTLVSSVPSISKTGAFVKSSPDDKKEEATPTFDTSFLPFGDVLRSMKTIDFSPDRDVSECSNESEDSKGNSLASRSSSSCLSSEPTPDSKQQASDEFVLVDVKPAFAVEDFSEDLSDFYHEFKNAPDLVMFEDGLGVETPETLMDLTKQLEDYNKEIESFDDFIKQLTEL